MLREEKATSKDCWWRPLLGARSREELPGRVSEETKGVCEVWEVGRGFIARAGVQARSSHIRKKARATATVGVQGLRVGTWLDQAAGGRSQKFSQPPELVCGIFPGHASTCPTFHLFYWRIIALQNFVVFYQTSTWISHRFTYVPSLLNLPPTSLPIPPF